MPDPPTTSRPEREKVLRDELMSAGLAAADEWLATRAHRRMSEVNRRRLVGHVVNALWDPIVDAALGMAHMVSGDVEAERDRLRALWDGADVEWEVLYGDENTVSGTVLGDREDAEQLARRRPGRDPRVVSRRISGWSEE